MNNIDLIQSKLNLTSKSLTLISDNLANINTPNFKRKYIDIQGDSGLSNQFSLQLNKASEKHITSSNTGEPSSKEVNSYIRTDNNGVDVNTEVMELSKISMFNNSLLRMLNTDFTNAKTIINSK